MQRLILALKYGYERQHGLLQCVCVCALFAVWQIPAQAQNPAVPAEGEVAGQYTDADVASGSQVYSAQCSACHGDNGDKVPGVNFVAGQFGKSASDGELRTVITLGNAGMPAFTLNPTELRAVLAYLRNMSTFNSRFAKVKSGDAAHGRTIFEGTGQCETCHRVNGKGSHVAPDLSNIGAMRSPEYLERHLLDPDAAFLAINRTVRGVTRDGKVITGRRLNEDTYSVQLIDQQEHLVSLVKADLREYTVLKTSGMQSYIDKLSSQDLADVVAYLRSLKGAQ
jgi:putative heme-binding domain-containing protein